MTDGDADRAAPVLARAFQDDPLFVWIEPDPGVRALFLARFMRALAWRSHLFAEAWTIAPLALGASLWVGPDLGALSPEQLQRSGLDRADLDLPAPSRSRSLETTKQANVAWYERHGFAVAVSGQVSGGGAKYWVLRREPRPR